MTTDGDAQGFRDLREGRFRTITPEVAALEARLALVARALEHATWMNRWQFDEHRTGGAGELKDEAYCRCDWCKTYRDTRYDDLEALNPTASVPASAEE